MDDTKCWSCRQVTALDKLANDGRCFTCFKKANDEQEEEARNIMELIDERLRVVIREELKKLLDKLE